MQKFFNNKKKTKFFLQYTLLNMHQVKGHLNTKNKVKKYKEKIKQSLSQIKEKKVIGAIILKRLNILLFH